MELIKAETEPISLAHPTYEENQKTEEIVKSELQTTEEQSEVVEVKETANLPEQPKSRISFDSIRQAIKKALGRGER